MIKFLLIGDFHYHKNISPVQVSHLETLLDRAAGEKVDFVLHIGDFCQDYAHSPELFKAYLENRHHLPVYGIYGNHEMESSELNTVEFITPRLCNRPVHFAHNGATYWYTDIKGYRIIGLDSNFSFREETGEWEHNLPGSYGGRSGNIHLASVYPKEMEWLESILEDARKKGMKAIPATHHPVCGKWGYCGNAAEVKGLYDQYADTISLVLNGDLHTDNFDIIDGLPYFGVNTAMMGWWDQYGIYGRLYPNETYQFTEYDESGMPLRTYERPYSQRLNSLFYTTPLSAVVQIDDDGTITITGSQSTWRHGIEPPEEMKKIAFPWIPDRKFKVEK